MGKGKMTWQIENVKWIVWKLIVYNAEYIFSVVIIDIPITCSNNILTQTVFLTLAQKLSTRANISEGCRSHYISFILVTSSWCPATENFQENTSKLPTSPAVNNRVDSPLFFIYLLNFFSSCGSCSDLILLFWPCNSTNKKKNLCKPK